MESLETDQKLEGILQEQLLKRLTDYGDSVLESSFKAKGKKKKKKLTSGIEDTPTTGTAKADSVGEELTTTGTAHSAVCPQRKNKKKKKHGKSQNEKLSLEEETEAKDSKQNLTGPKKHVGVIVGQLGLKQFKSSLERQGTRDLINLPENDAGNKSVSKREPEVIVFKSRKYEKSKEILRPEAKPQEEQGGGRFDIKEARFEVRKFGLAGFHGDEKEKAMTDLLLRLGAKPKKKAYINYTELQQQRKELLTLEAEKREQDREQGFNVRKKNRKRPRDRNDIGSVDGQVGKFQRGVQYIKPNDVQGIKKSKLKSK